MIMRQLFAIVSLAAWVGMASVVWAKPVEFIRDYSYMAGEADSKLSCRIIALEQAKRLLLEELGTYLVSNTIVSDSRLTKDEIVTYTAGVVVTVIIEERWDGQTYFLKAKIKADADEVAKSIALIRQDQGKASELEKLKKQTNESLLEIERLKQQLALAQQPSPTHTASENSSLAIRRTYDKTIQELSARDFLEQGTTYRNNRQYEQSIAAFKRAGQLAPDWAYPHIGVGVALLRLKQYQPAQEAFAQAWVVEPDNAVALSFYGVSLFMNGQQATGSTQIELAFTKAPDDPVVLINKGWLHLMKFEPSRAVELLTRVLVLQEMKNPRALYFRGLAYRQLGERDKAEHDLEQAAKLGESDAVDTLQRLQRSGRQIR